MKTQSDRRMRVLLAAILITVAVPRLVPAQQKLNTILDFDFVDGANPYAGLVQGLDGNLYGTTFYGGSMTVGTVFKITPTGRLATLYAFCMQTNCADGEEPVAGLVLATDGNFYGSTAYGGLNDFGTVFRITPGGTLTTLYSFCAQTSCADGAIPYGNLVQGTDGNFYGTTYEGGEYDGGTVFRITSSGTLSTLYSFCSQTNCADGYTPFAGLIQAANGSFYGVTYFGGANSNSICSSTTCGTIFKITSAGVLTTLYDFCGQTNCADGALPYAGLMQATDGNLYGTTALGGADGKGTVFRITPAGALRTLQSFTGIDGAYPEAGLIQATDGTLYGTTTSGGLHNNGSVFKITLEGMLTTLASFDNVDGQLPSASLVEASSGTLYSTTTNGGSSQSCSFGTEECGTVFSLTVGLGPFVETLPTSGKVGSAVKILGTTLTGATSVAFNGVSAAFTVVSPSEINTTVPSGATTGNVQVVTPGGTLSSNVPFRVLQ